MSSEAAVTSSVEIVEPPVNDVEIKLLDLVMRAVAERSTLKIRYHPREGCKFGASDYAVMEQNLGRFLCGVLELMGAKFSDGFRFRFNMGSIKQLDGDGDWLDVTIPFGEILKPKAEGEVAAEVGAGKAVPG